MKEITMSADVSESTSRAVLERSDFQKLLDLLGQHGYQIIGPTVDSMAIVYDDVAAVDQLPIGYRDQQENGRYRLSRTDNPSLFDYNAGQHGWKGYLYPSEQKLWTASRNNDGFEVKPVKEDPTRRAFLGVRSCDLHAIAIQDKILLGGPYRDSHYARRRDNILIIAVNCTRAGGTCFCSSMGTGPKAEEGFDLALTEVMEDSRHYFVIQGGSEPGRKLLYELPVDDAGEAEINAAEQAVARATGQMGRTLDAGDVKELLYRNFDHLRWEETAKRCLTCGNCTLVCPTCFCATVQDASDLVGKQAERTRLLDSCFTIDFSYIHGGSIRTSGAARYRQWLTHKLSYWHDQFGMLGCVGCGRCITWCPVGIDITEEVRALRQSELENVESGP